ncbi:bifunctional diguanylate cyclase/phosphodiesterase [Actinoplanes sp. N902-109]|uniref:putative bifunctional diguanylate cyclase/phosphodiesterase n=1 Tax=Actinoplanes sp. (strain N902-109) TaxID=649831 RepID=UPI0003293D83|nr:EAL domain-containing protein [Actinoplanes sp. N902-109]AGL18516.1 diguanylate cyclase/phosphodiesterase [Actinoplanes sp. N902-109]
MRKGPVDRVVVLWMLAGLTVSFAYPFMSDGTPAAAVVYSSFTTATLTAILAGVRRNRPAQRAGWYVFTAAVLMRLGGDISYEVYRQVLHRQPMPSAADIFYFAAYPLMVVGVLMIAKGRVGRDWAGILDAAIISTGLSLVWWVFVVGPMASDTAQPVLERLIGAAYPALDLLLIALVVRLLTRSQRPGPSLKLLTAGMVTLLASDVAYQLVMTYAPAWQGAVAFGWLMSNTVWGAAALHRSAAERPAAAEEAGGTLGRARLALLAACLLLVPALLFVEGLTAGSARVSWLAVGIGAVVLFVLVLARTGGFVAQVRRQARQLEELALRDALTGLANRRVFEDRLAAAVATGTPQVAVLDLDGFKEINDRLGHAVGDRLLAVVGRRLAAALREDDLVVRMGGDEFAVLVETAGQARMTAIVERLAAALRRPVETDGHELLIGASIGSADGSGTTDPVEVLRRADIAMYAAKEAGGGRHRHYTADLDTRAGEQARLGADIRIALDTGQFHLVYQPIVELATGKLRSVEALIRWEHPERGFVSPAEFIPVAEQNGLIVELGEWVLRTACAQAVTWQREYGAAAPAKMAVNVSARQLAEPGFPGLVAEVLAWTGLGAAGLVVEVTETAVFGGGQTVQTVKDLHALGITIALDDFGTGHSSLTLLQTVPVDVLKVDKSFVDTITMAGRHAVIATALIQVADGLGLAAVAEGVETAEQATELRRLGYRYAQGYHFGRPAAQPAFTTARTPVA